MINKRRPCRLNIFIRLIFHFYRQKSTLGSLRKVEWDKAGRQVPAFSLKDMLLLPGYCKNSFEKWDID